MKKFILLLILISGCSKSEDDLRIDIVGKWNGYQLTINGDDIKLDFLEEDEVVIDKIVEEIVEEVVV